MSSGTITTLFQYPVKSMAGFSCQKATALPSGFEWDRRWMLIGVDNKMITQREMPILCRYFPTIHNGRLQIQFEDRCFSIATQETEGPTFLSKVWDDDALVVNTSGEINEWLSKELGQSVRLVKMLERFHFAGPLNSEVEVSGADGYPYLVLGTASMDLLSEKSGESIDIRRFRPNIVLKTNTPHEEDDWASLFTNDVNFQKVKPCLRCQIIDIDQDSGQRMGTVTKTLSTYRRMGNNIGFGGSYVGLNSGELVVGGEFWVE